MKRLIVCLLTFLLIGSVFSPAVLGAMDDQNPNPTSVWTRE